MCVYDLQSIPNVKADKWICAPIHTFVALLLFVAAGLKLSDSALAKSVPHVELWALAIPAIEIVVGCVLFFDGSRRASIIGICLFGCFATYSLSAIASNSGSCGCLGSTLTIPPAVMLGADALILAALGIATWANALVRSPRHRISGPILVALACCMVATCLIVATTLAATGGLAREQSYFRVNPQEWVGRNVLPITGKLPAPKEFYDGDWELLLLNSDCPECTEFFRLRVIAARESSSRIAVIWCGASEIPRIDRLELTSNESLVEHFAHKQFDGDFPFSMQIKNGTCVNFFPRKTSHETN
jgi:hypothetical protein